MVSLQIGGDFRLPLVSVVQKLLFVVQKLLAGFCGILKVGALRKMKNQVENTIQKLFDEN
jgi:hypothetical protein